MNVNITRKKSIFIEKFLGNTPKWYKLTIIIFLIINPICFLLIDKKLGGWLLMIEFIFTLAMALKCYPLQSGGLLIIESVIIGMTKTENISNIIHQYTEVILLLIFMVSSIHFLKPLLLYIFTKFFLSINSKRILSLFFCLGTALLSAFLDALTVIAILISISFSFYNLYQNYTLNNYNNVKNIITNNQDTKIFKKMEFKSKIFSKFLRNLIMHAVIGTALGGVMTIVGEPQNLIIAKSVQWNFNQFFLHMLPVTFPVLFSSILLCYLLEKYKLFGYGIELNEDIKNFFKEYNSINKKINNNFELLIQVFVTILLIITLVFHLAEVGLIGLSIIILMTVFCGLDEKNVLKKSCQEILPFTGLLITFFAVMSIIIDQQLFKEFISFILEKTEKSQILFVYLFNGLLSTISDNVFVGAIYIREALNSFNLNLITKKQYEYLVVAINTGTNLPSIATPNGQAAFLYLLTSPFAKILNLSYKKMMYMSLPYTIVISIVGLISINFFLIPTTTYFIQLGLLPK
ncbi:MAG: sodium/proton antiporter NhaB [Arsenophonus sp.]|nr:MAG: sodium/proton antiporter NhaB [Arsenophonus sp.]